MRRPTSHYSKARGDADDRVFASPPVSTSLSCTSNSLGHGRSDEVQTYIPSKDSVHNVALPSYSARTQYNILLQPLTIGQWIALCRAEGYLISRTMSEAGITQPPVMSPRIPFQYPFPYDLQRIYHPPHNSNRVELQEVLFSVDGQIGFPLSAARARNYIGLDNRHAPFITSGPSVSNRLEVKEFLLAVHLSGIKLLSHLQFLGYGPWASQFKCNDWCTPPKPITIEKLSYEIAKSVEKFIEVNEHVQVDANYTPWRVGTGYINLDRLCLVAFRQASKSSWQPVLALMY